MDHLVGRLGVPKACVKLELGLSAYDPKIRDRVDLVVFSASSGQAVPILLAECKAPGVALDEAVVAQVRRYLRLIPARWVLVTNGSKTRSWRLQEDGWAESPLVTWDELKA